MVPVPVFDRIHTGVLRFVTVKSAPGDIVDVGCGTGRLLRKIRERWPHARLTGIDPAEGMVKKARHLMPDAAFMVSPAECIPLPDASADLVFRTRLPFITGQTRYRVSARYGVSYVPGVSFFSLILHLSRSFYDL